MAMPIEHYPVLEAASSLFSSFVAFMISYYAYKAYRMGVRQMIFLSSGFTLLSVSMLIRAYVLGSLVMRGRMFLAVGYVGSIVERSIMVLSYLLIAASYIEWFKGEEIMVAVSPLLLYIPATELVSMVILLYIAFTVTIAFMESRVRNTLYVSVAFYLVALSHALYLLAGLTRGGLFYGSGSLLKLAGFLILLWVMVRTAGKGR